MTNLEIHQETVGYEVVVERYTGAVATEQETKVWRGSRSTLRRRAILLPRVKQVVSMTPVSRSQWLAAYGDPSRKAES